MSYLKRVKKNKVEVDLTQYCIMLLGGIKTGKTTFYADLVTEFFGTSDAGLLLPFEKGYTCLNDVNIFPHVFSLDMEFWNEEKAKFDIKEGWNVFTSIIDELVKGRKEHGIKMIGIDTLDNLFSLAEKHFLRDWNRTNPAKRADSINGAYDGYGKGLEKVYSSVYEQIQKLRRAGFGLVIINHSRLKTIKKDVINGEYNQIGSALTERYFQEIAKDCDIIGHLVVEKTVTDKKVEETHRTIRFRDDGFVLAGTRLPAEFPAKLPLDVKVFKKEFEKIILNLAGGEEQLDVLKKESEEKVERLASTKSFEEMDNIELVGVLRDYVVGMEEEAKRMFQAEVANLGINLKEPESCEKKALIYLIEFVKGN